jgi:hypothetical protein
MDDLRNRVAETIYAGFDGDWDYEMVTGYCAEDMFGDVSRAILDEILTTHTITPIPETVHGTIYTYTKKRCRCDECREANRDYSREYRAGLRREARKHG